MLLRIPLSLLFSSLNSPSLPSNERSSRPFIIFVTLLYLQHVQVSVALGSSELERSRCESPVLSGGKDHLPQPAPDTSSGAVGPFCHKGTSLPCVQLRVHQDLQILCCQTASKTSVFCSSSLPFAELSEIPFSHFISLSRHL